MAPGLAVRAVLRAALLLCAALLVSISPRCCASVPSVSRKLHAGVLGASCPSPILKPDALKTHQGGAVVCNHCCVDGNTIIVHDPKLLDVVESGDGSRLPTFNSNKFQEFHKHQSRNPHPLRPVMGSNCNHDSLRFRYPSSAEIKRVKHFSNCTVPILLFGHWMHTFAEFFTRGPAWMWKLMVEEPVLDKNVTLVLASCGSIPLSPHHYQLMQPFSNHQVTSWTALASRASSNSRSNSTAEGTHARCFSQMVIMGLDHAAWSSTYKSSQWILQHYQKQGVVPQKKLFTSGPATLKILFEFRAADSQVHSGTIRPHNTQGMPANHPEVEKLRSSHAVHEPSEFRNRSVYPGVRLILNLADVLAACSSYKGWAEVLKGTNWTGVECQAYSFGRDLHEGMAVAQETDVMISMHGSGEMNSMFMRPGTVKIQLRSKEFGTVHRYMSNGYWPRVCHQNNFPFYCFFVNFDEDDTWEPGVLERFGLFNEGQAPSFSRRDRHLRLKFQHLVTALQEYLPLQANRTEFLRRWAAKKIAMTFNANNTVTYFQHMDRKAAARRRHLRADPLTTDASEVHSQEPVSVPDTLAERLSQLPRFLT